jgi:hypothetical protein
MTELETAITATLRAEAQGAAMSTDTPHEQEILESRLDLLDRQTKTRRVMWGAVAAVAAVVLVAVGARAFRGPDNAVVVAPTPPLFASTSFGVPFTVESLPSWLTTQSLGPGSEAREWVIWNRCPDGGGECIGLQFNRYSEVQGPKSRTTVTFATYLDYLERLGRSGQISITGRTDTTVDGHRAVVYSITSAQGYTNGVGCYSLGQAHCDDFFADVPGRYAVIDTGSLDPDGAVFVVWTRAGGVGPAESGWLEQFDQMLTTLRFVPAATPSVS